MKINQYENYTPRTLADVLNQTNIDDTESVLAAAIVLANMVGQLQARIAVLERSLVKMQEAYPMGGAR